MRTEKRRRLAVHESAHAVVANCLGREVRTVTIKPRRNGNSGYCQLADQGDFEQDLLIGLAGTIAESLLQGGRADYLLEDVPEAYRLARLISNEDTGASLLIGRAATICEQILVEQ
jgi:hypothetical protein